MFVRQQIVCENWRNLISVGAKPLAITNCLNFGNPENENIMGEFAECLEGMNRMDLKVKSSIMSPNGNAVELSKKIANSFKL